MAGEIKTTGQLRAMLVEAAQKVLDGSLDIHKATAVHKLAKNVTESLYSENKIAQFNRSVGATVHSMGTMPICSDSSPEAAGQN